ncbi:hypothetical protein THRCLA_22910 [Thraustotheca clavata]|uniref:Secreted protein n=1 Tax=Thraustotheca clavata TaxID=74557 RepID=A0A1V9YPJ2_9STRA|nr:hypothetical protein THRCLA_22910 [Thraustotheca clavata]
MNHIRGPFCAFIYRTLHFAIHIVVLTSPSRSATHMICLRPAGYDYKQAMIWNAEGSMLRCFSANLWNAETFVLSNHITTFLRPKLLWLWEQISPILMEKILMIQPATFVVCAYQTGCIYKIVGIQWLAGCLAVRTSMLVAFQGKTLCALSHQFVMYYGTKPNNLEVFTARTTPSRDDVQAIIRLTGACWSPGFEN